MTLIERLKQINHDSEIEMHNTPGLWIGMLTENIEYWAEFNVTTAEELDDYLDACHHRAIEKDRY